MKTLKLSGWLGASLAAAVLLAGCNSGEDFSDADLGGPIIQPSPTGDTLNPDSDSTLIEFAAGGGANDSAGNTEGVVNNLGFRCVGSGTASFTGNGTDVDPGTAVCSRDDEAVEFFIGSTSDPDKRVVLGKVWIPAGSNQGRYQVSTTDMIESPSMVDPTADARVLHMAALLQALDADPATPRIVDIPPEAHDAVANCCDGIPAPPDPPFDETKNYSDFQTDWQNWLDHVETQSGATLDFPAQADAEEQLQKSLDRLRAGTFSAQALGSDVFGRSILESLNRDQSILFQIPVLVFPDGRTQGVGLVFEASDANNRGLVKIRDGAELTSIQKLVDPGESLDAWTMVETDGSQQTASIELAGRVLGNSTYYDEEGDDIPSDYDVDYPDADFQPVPGEDPSRFDGSAFNGAISDSDGLYWMTRSGLVSVDWEPVRLQDLTMNQGDRFYDITLYRACVGESDDGSFCQPIDAKEIGSGLNYPETIGSDDAQIEVTEERVKQDVMGNTDFRIQILDDGNIVTDTDKDCSDVTGDPGSGYDDGDNTEYRVGFVSRTADDSFNMVLYMAGGPHNVIPQYGTQVQGRVNLAGSDELLRLGDENFSNGIRAFWRDLYRPIRFDQSESSGNDLDSRKFSALFSGAAQGAPACP